VKAEEMKRLLQTNFPNGRYTSIATTGEDPASAGKAATAATKAYEGVYDLYLSGQFAEAETAKRAADSAYRTSTWAPQLLYIQAVAQVKQQQDSAAVQTLNTLILQNPNTVLAEKARTLKNVLGRRQQIEEELRNMQVQRPAEDSILVESMPIAQRAQQQQTVAPRRDSLAVGAPIKPRTDSSARKPTVAPTVAGSPYRYSPDSAHYAVVVLQKVDAVFVNEARNAFVRYNSGQGNNYDSRVETVNGDTKLLLIGPFINAADAVNYILTVKPVAGSQILPWLKASSYSYSIITAGNLNAVQAAKTVDAYKAFLEPRLPVKLQ
jgi:hypothetical protein